MFGILSINSGHVEEDHKQLKLSISLELAVTLMQYFLFLFVDKPSTSLALNAYKEVILGRQIILVCKFDSQPLSRIHWEKNKIVLNDSTHSITTRIVQSSMFSTSLESNLSINAATKNDHASYGCIATNAIGNLTQSTSIKILCKLEFSTRPL